MKTLEQIQQARLYYIKAIPLEKDKSRRKAMQNFEIAMRWCVDADPVSIIQDRCPFVSDDDLIIKDDGEQGK